MTVKPANVVSLWQQQLICDARGNPKPLLANVITGLRLAPEWKGILQFDELRQIAFLSGKLPWANDSEERDWTDTDDIQAADWFQHRDIHVPPTIISQAIDVVAKEHGFHPVREYLNSLQWDGIPRLDSWAIRYLGAEDILYARTVSAKWMISAVARIMQPGCKADCALILEGAQGTLKSTAVHVLAEPWSSDELAEMGSKDASMQTIGTWVIEIAELDAMTRTEVHKIKAFMSRRTDRFRKSYGRRVEEFPRQCVFVGTVNMNDYLRDETGGRRFWPIACGFIDIESLRKDRDQLWAEATHRYNDGQTWWLDDPLMVQAAQSEQRGRYKEDAWQASIEEFLIGRDIVTVAEILAGIGLPKDKWGQTEQNRVASCLRSIGWQRLQIRTLSGHEGQRKWVYKRPFDPMSPLVTTL